MPSAVFIYATPTPFIAVEDPDVVEQAVEAARADEQMYVHLHSMASYFDLNKIDKEKVVKMSPQEMMVAAERKESYTDLKLRSDLVFAIRGTHPGEVPEP